MELEVIEPKRLEEGKHIGVIIGISHKKVNDKYDYAEIHIDTKGSHNKVGYPINGMKTSRENMFGQLLQLFGIELRTGKKVDVDKVLVGQKVTFLVKHETKNGKTYSNIIADSLKPSRE